MIAVQQLLLRQRNEFPSCHGIDAFHHANGGESPTAAALAAIHMLILHWPYHALLNPVDFRQRLHEAVAEWPGFACAAHAHERAEATSESLALSWFMDNAMADKDWARASCMRHVTGHLLN